jgi:hypothetical protein
MPTYVLGRRIGVSESRVRQLELAEVNRSIRLSFLERAARALDCQLVYVLVPNRPLDEMVKRQARLQAERRLASSVSGGSDESTGSHEEDPVLTAAELTVLASQLAHRRGLWTDLAARRTKPPTRY